MEASLFSHGCLYIPKYLQNNTFIHNSYFKSWEDVLPEDDQNDFSKQATFVSIGHANFPFSSLVLFGWGGVRQVLCGTVKLLVRTPKSQIRMRVPVSATFSQSCPISCSIWQSKYLGSCHSCGRYSGNSRDCILLQVALSAAFLCIFTSQFNTAYLHMLLKVRKQMVWELFISSEFQRGWLLPVTQEKYSNFLPHCSYSEEYMAYIWDYNRQNRRHSLF